MTIMNKKLEKEYQKRMQQQHFEDTATANKNRAKSVTVGTAFSGVTELMMRRPNGEVTWATLQPVEVIELIHQLAAGIGCHLHLQPREDFASWRSWNPQETKMLSSHLNGHPPHAHDINPHELRGRILPKPKDQPGMQPALMNIPETEEQELLPNLNNGNSTNEETLAIKKLNNK